jgi:DNA-binding response OmpR family regulator
VADPPAAGPVVLLVDDDPAIRRAVAAGLELEGFAVVPASGGRAALEAAARVQPAVILLDLSMPDLDGLEVLQRLRAGGDQVPVCVLSARDEVDDRVAGLQAGADDYVVKPFALEEVVARLHALLRRRPAGADEALVVGDLRLDPRTRVAQRGERRLDLTRREFELLQLLAESSGRVLEREAIYQRVWGYAMAHGDRSVDVFIRKIRQKLAKRSPGWTYVHTHFGVGYRFEPEAAGGDAGPAPAVVPDGDAQTIQASLASDG